MPHTKEKPISERPIRQPLKYLPEGCPYMLMYSALHKMQWFSQILDVLTPKIRRKFVDFNIFMNQNKRRLHNIQYLK